MSAIYDIRDYGARAEPAAMNTVAIQAAVDACHRAGGGRVVCVAGSYRTGTLTLKSGVELHLAAGCRLVGSADLADYTAFEAPGFRAAHAPEKCTHSLVCAVRAEGIALSGPGEIDGSGLAFYDQTSCGARFFKKPATPRPRMVMFYQCRNVLIQEAGFVDSPCWTMWLMQCRDVRIHRVRVRGDQRMINNDGIDVDACRRVTISDSHIKTSDDCLVLRAIQRCYDEPALCEDIAVSNCVLDSWCQGVRVGCPADGVIRNAVFNNLVIHSAGNGIYFEYPRRYLPEGARGSADVHDILFSNILIESAGYPIRLAVDDGIALQRLAGIAFCQCRIRAGKPCVVQGSRETEIQDIHFSDMTLEGTGCDTVLCRHCRGVVLDRVRITHRLAE